MNRLYRYCKNAFGRFYALRKLCITYAIQTLFKREKLSQFHINPRVTIKHYINMRSFNLLNNAFDLNLSNQQNEARKLKFLLSLDSDILIVK